MAQVHHKIGERPPIRIPPRTEAERRQQIIALNDEYNQLYDIHPDYDIDSITYLPAGREILRPMKIMERLADKLPNHIRIELFDTHHYLYMKNQKKIFKTLCWNSNSDTPDLPCTPNAQEARR